VIGKTKKGFWRGKLIEIEFGKQQSCKKEKEQSVECRWIKGKGEVS